KVGSPDRMNFARAGLMGMSLGFVMNAQPESRMPWVPAAMLFLLALSVPKFRVLGWWLAAVFTTLFTALAIGIGLNFLRTLLAGTGVPGLLRGCILTGVVATSGIIALYGLFARGTRAGVE